MEGEAEEEGEEEEKEEEQRHTDLHVTSWVNKKIFETVDCSETYQWRQSDFRLYDVNLEIDPQWEEVYIYWTCFCYLWIPHQVEEVFNLKSEWNEQTRRYGRRSLTAELHGKEEGEEEGEEEEDAGVEPEGAQDVGVVVEGGGYSDEEEKDDHDDEGEAVDDKSLELEWSALPAKDPLKSFDSESGWCRLGEVEVAGGEEKTSGRVQEQTPFHLITYLVDRFDWIDLF